jgi:hypothetical protein
MINLPLSNASETIMNPVSGATAALKETTSVTAGATAEKAQRAPILNLFCPTCGSRLKAVATKICAECGSKILMRHKYVFCSDGRVRHRNCADPEAYLKQLAAKD